MISFARAAAFAVLSGCIGCAVQRSHIASEAQADMVGMKKGDVLSCTGPPVADTTADNIEVWSYNSGDGRVVSMHSLHAFTTGQSFTSGNATLTGGSASFGNQSFGSTDGSAFGTGFTRRYYCTVNIVFDDGRVSRVNYSGPTGALLAPKEQCGYAVQNCLLPAK